MPETLSEKKCPAAAVYRKSAGFTLIEILIAVAIIAILTGIAYPVYTSYIDRASITVSVNTLEAVRKAMEDYSTNFRSYPPAIDLATGEDGQGRVVLPPALLEDFKKSLFSLESYAVAANDYTLTARARDTKRTLLSLTPAKIVTQGP